ncbi:MAG: DUF3656 domain-containing protein [Lachnospiraceae bacterium]|nr:DUF3656 domain-containing protein [Lachnospiraceae bacterium]
MNAELLAPAGSFEALEAALAAGADAVYLGGTRFGARAYADNLNTEDLCRAIDLVHRQDKKLFMTVNTLLKEEELQEELYSFMLPFYREGLDGVIVQDLGVIRAFGSWFPELPLHGSTQMAITGASSAELMKQEGLTRVVPARELSLAEIREIHEKTELEIECFIHGAMCYSYSGLCLMSSMIGGRSGNRGRCAGTCRLPYEVYEQGKRLNGPNTAYPLNTRDMCTLELLPEILDAGVLSLKIEGRMKKPEYTAGVVSVYRKYLDLLAEFPEKYSVDPKDMNFLYDLFNRDGFHKGYFQVHNGREMMALKNAKLTEAKQKDSSRLYERIRKEWKSVRLQKPVQGYLSLRLGEPARLVLLSGDLQVQVEREGIQKAQNQPLTRERAAAQLNKTGNSPFFFEHLEIEMDEDLFLPMQLLNELRREGMEQLEDKLRASFARKAPDEQPSLTEIAAPTEGKPAVSDIWILTDTREQLQAVGTITGITGVCIPIGLLDKADPAASAEKLLKDLKAKGMKLRIALPYMVRGTEDSWYRDYLKTLLDLGVERFLIRSPESAARLWQMGLAEHCILDYCIYTMNSRAKDFYRSWGFGMDTVPLELNAGEIKSRNNENSELVIYGRTPMMISAQCLKKNLDRCTKGYAQLSLKDRKGKTFPVRCCCDGCYNVIYNSLPTSLLKDSERISAMGCASLRVHFTTESGKEAGAVIEEIVNTFIKGVSAGERKLPESTRGHFKRGVE